MTNDTIKLFKDIAEKSVASFKNVGELNLRTFEALAAKQVEIVQNAADAGVKQSAIFTDSKDVNDYYQHSLTLLTLTLKHLLKVLLRSLIFLRERKMS